MSRKRSSAVVKTTMLGTAGLSAMFVLTGCEPEQQVDTFAYKSVAECSEAGVFTPQYCQTSFEQAVADHKNLAPKYESVQDCEFDFGAGNCGAEGTDPALASANASNVVEEHHHSHSSFVPFFYGYMMGGGGSSGSTTTHYYSSPVYRGAQGSPIALSGTPVPSSAFSRSGVNMGLSGFSKPSAPTTMARGQSFSSRGGFGGTGRAGASFGG